jgi:hypothetical protein
MNLLPGGRRSSCQCCHNHAGCESHTTLSTPHHLATLSSQGGAADSRVARGCCHVATSTRGTNTKQSLQYPQDTSIIPGTVRWTKSRVWQGGTGSTSSGTQSTPAFLGTQPSPAPSPGTWPSRLRRRVGGGSGIASILLIVLVHLTSIHAVQVNKVHEMMGEEDLMAVFQVSSHHLVPEYEVVHVHHRRQKRSADQDQIHQVELSAFGRSLSLSLSRNVHLVPQHRPLSMFLADKDSHQINYVEDESSSQDGLGEIYQDEENEAAVLLYNQHKSQDYVLDGTIGDDLVIKPAPTNLKQLMKDEQLTGSTPPSHWSTDWDEGGEELEEEEEPELPVDYAFLDEEDDISGGNRVDRNPTLRRRKREAEEIHTGLHIVYKRKDNSKHSGDYESMEFGHEGVSITDHMGYKNISHSHIRRKRQAPFMIFPEILVIVDYDGYRLHGEDNIAIKRYVISFWNGVDLRYRLLKGPSVKISIAGIIISRGRDATPYLERNRVGRDAIDAASALTDMGKYLFLERRLPVYDIAVAITKLDMCRRKTRHGDCNRGTAGFAYVGGACVVNKRLEKVNSVAIVEDTGGFSGIIVAAHELGHLLGAVHDGSPPPSYLGGPGAVKCRWEDGYIMSDLRHTSKGFKWSYCTVNQFHHFLNGETATCMYNSPHEDESLPRVLPGKLLSLDAQCRKDRGTSACFQDDRVCAQLFCFDAGSGYCVSYRPAAEGSRCGDNQMCLNGKCVREHENAIDYGEGAFLRRTGSAISPTFDKSPSQRTLSTVTTPNPPPLPPTPATPLPPTEPPPIESPAEPTSEAVTTTKMPWWKRLRENSILRHLTSTTTSTTSTSTTTTTTTTTTTMTTTTTTTSTTSTSTEPYRARSRSSSAVESGDSEENSLEWSGEECKDRITNIAGSMSCKAFLRSFAYQYCKHKYIKKNCCESHKRFCSGSTHG